MAKVKLLEIAHARSGDKGNSSNIGVIAREAKFYPILCRELTAERVRQHFKGICFGEVVRYELPNILALNFVLKESLDGGGTVSLRSDAQGKTHAATLIMLEIENDVGP
jgi:hypothetical protein